MGFEITGEVEGGVVPVAAVIDQIGDAVDDHGLQMAYDAVAQELGEAAVGDEPAAVQAQRQGDAG